MADALVFGEPLALGLLIGLYESIIIHRDITVATHRFGHMVHAFLLSIAFTFATMNTNFVLGLIPQLQSIPVLGTALGLNIAIGLIAAIKIHAVSKVVKTTAGATGLGETWFHSILIGGLIAAAPYLFPLIEPVLPGWIKGW